MALFCYINRIKGGLKLGERQTKKHHQYTLEEKNEIIKMYFAGESKGIGKLARDLGITMKNDYKKK